MKNRTEDSTPRYRHVLTIPLPFDKDKRYTSHLARQARKFADIAQNALKALNPESEENDWTGYAAAVVGDRGSGKSTWINFVMGRLQEGGKHRWVTVQVDLSLVNASEIPRSESLPFFLIWRSLNEHFNSPEEDNNQQPSQTGSPPEQKQTLNTECDREAKDETGSALKDLKKYASQIALGEELAGQAALAFSADQKEFAEIYADLSFDAAQAMKQFATTLKKLCFKKNLKVLLIIDDIDMVTDAVHDRLVPRLVWGTLYLAEHAPVLRILSVAPGRWQEVLGIPQREKYNSGETIGWTRKALGFEFFLSPMNEIRKMVFLQFPKPEDTREDLEGRIVWAEALDPGHHSEIIPSPPLLKNFVDKLVSADYYKNWDGKKDRLPEYRVNGLLEEKKKQPIRIPDNFYAQYLANFIRLFPDNRREAVVATNYLIDQREQVLTPDYQLPFDLVFTWQTFEHRFFRAMMCIGYTRWPESMLGDLLWRRPTELVQAIKNGAIKDIQQPSLVQIEPEKGPTIISDKLESLRNELGLNSSNPSKSPSEQISLQRVLLKTLHDVFTKNRNVPQSKETATRKRVPSKAKTTKKSK